ncbi:sensor histidine kinase [Oleiharenicola lentus]|uniref:sensor histidine kinase n=1 Tax=Oleiharenicola lentus TaxID=2508720 RepID=UPI003F678E52
MSTLSTPRPIKFLLVDDLEPNLLALSALLQREGLELLHARSGDAALELLLTHEVALAILDVQMPGMDGFELAELMRGTERTRRVPIIFLTAGAVDTQRRFRGYELGAVDFLFKPIEAHILQSKTGVFFELAKQRESLQLAQQKLSEHANDLEKIVAERTARLRETVQELEGFSYSIAHDMRAPLRGMQSFAQLLTEEYAGVLDDTGRDYLQRISGSANRLDALIRDVLDYAKVMRTEAALRPVDLGKLLGDILATYPNFHSTKAEVRVVGTLPVVLGQDAFATQCLSNVLSNAVKFVRPGTKPAVKIWAEDHDPDSVRIWIEDNGIGIAEKDRGRVFRMFDRLHPAEQFEGTGIGLTIARKAAERMGGNLGFESEVDRGSRFWIDLRKTTALAG